MKAAALALVVVVLGALAVVVAGVAIANRGSHDTTAADASAPADTEGCAYLAGWRRLADRIDAPVYCPGWIPTPLTAQIGGQWNNIRSVDPDRSYLMGFVWQETAFGGKVSEVHVNFRGQPGNTRIPTCQDVSTVAGVTRRKNIPCFQDPDGHDELGEWDRRDEVHREPRRRLVARAARLAPRRRALHAQRARRAARDVRAGAS